MERHDTLESKITDLINSNASREAEFKDKLQSERENHEIRQAQLTERHEAEINQSQKRFVELQTQLANCVSLLEARTEVNILDRL